MRKLFILFILFLIGHIVCAQVKVPGVNWNESYRFDKVNAMKVDFYDKKGKIMRSFDYKTHYQTSGKDFTVRMFAPNKFNNIETVFDLKNEVCIQVFGAGTEEPMYNAGKFKYPSDEELKKLDLIETDETKTILGKLCKRYTYTYKKIWGEAWITTAVDLSNDYGIFRAAKMASLHNTLSVGGFVMEMTSEDATGAKTVMYTTPTVVIR
jgi:hypothetical protein